MLDEMPSSLLAEWEHYYRQEPFGQTREDYLLGLLVQIMFNANRPPDSSPLSLEEILHPRPLPQVSQAEQAAVDAAWVEAMIASGKVIDMRSHRKNDVNR